MICTCFIHPYEPCSRPVMVDEKRGYGTVNIFETTVVYELGNRVIENDRGVLNIVHLL